MEACVYEMKMPARYADLSAEELEYDGAWGFWTKVAICVGIAALCVVAPYAIAVVATTIALTASSATVAAAASVVAVSAGATALPIANAGINAGNKILNS